MAFARKSLLKLAVREIKSSWAQYLSMIGIGAIAITLFVGLLANAASIEGRVNEAYTRGNMADIWATTSRYEADDVNRIHEYAGERSDIEGRFVAPASVGESTAQIAILPKLPTISKPYEISKPTPEHSEEHFFLVDKALVETSSNPDLYTPGSSLTLTVDVSSYLPTSPLAPAIMSLIVKEGKEFPFANGELKLSFPITGLMLFPENVTRASYNTGVALLDDHSFFDVLDATLKESLTPLGVRLIYDVLHRSDLAFGDGSTTYSSPFCKPNQYLVTAPKGQVKSIEKRIEEGFAEKSSNNLLYLHTRATLPFVLTLNGDVNQARSFTFFFPLVFFLVGVLVVSTTLNQTIIKQRTEIGTMKALGFTKGEIYRHYFALSLAVAAIGVLIGEIVGPLLIPAILGQKYAILYMLPARKYVFPVLGGLLTALFYFLATGIVTFLAAHREVKLAPAASMRPSAPKGFKRAFKNASRPRGVKTAAFKMAFRNLLVDAKKSMMVIFGVMGCTALLTAGFGIEDTLDYDIAHDMAYSGRSDISLTLSAGQEEGAIISGLNGYQGDLLSYEAYERARTDFQTKGVGLSATAFLTFHAGTRNVDGSSSGQSHCELKPKDPSKCLVSKKTAREIRCKVGDQVAFSYRGKSYTVEVEGFYEAFMYHGIIIDPTNPKVFTEAARYTSVYLDRDPASSLTLDQLGQKAMKSVPNAASYETSAKTKARVRDIMGGVYIMTNAIKVFAILLALVVLYNLALLNFKERERQIATFKVLGLSSFEIALVLVFEAVLLTGIGVALGLLLGYPFTVVTLKLNIVDLVEYLFHIDVSTYFIAFALTFLVSLSINIILSLRNRKVKMIEALKSVE